MTVEAETVRKDYTGDGTDVTFPTTFTFRQSGDVKAYLDGTCDGDITVSGGAGSTGTVVFDDAPSSGAKVVLVRESANTQELDASGDIEDQDIEDSLDDVFRRLQELEWQIKRTIRLAPADLNSGEFAALPDPTDRQGKALGFTTDSDASPTVVAGLAPTDVTVSAYMETLLNSADEAAFKAAVNLEAGTDFLAPTGDGSGLSDLPSDVVLGDTHMALSTGYSLTGDGDYGTVTGGTVTVDLTKPALCKLTMQESFTLRPDATRTAGVQEILVTIDATDSPSITPGEFDFVDGTLNNANAAKNALRITQHDAYNVLEIVDLT